MRLDNKTVVITGASSGLGRAIAVRLSHESDLVLVARTGPQLQAVAANIHERTGRAPMVCRCDVSSESEVERLAGEVMSRHPRVDVLVNCAGIATYRPSLTLASADMRRQFQVNVFGPFYLIRALMPALALSEAGYVLNIGSLFGRTALAENSLYAATKFALTGYTQGLSRELRDTTVRVGIFNPGPMTTNLHASSPGIRTPRALLTDVDVMARHAERAIQRRSTVASYPRRALLVIELRTWLQDRGIAG